MRALRGAVFGPSYVYNMCAPLWRVVHGQRQLGGRPFGGGMLQCCNQVRALPAELRRVPVDNTVIGGKLQDACKL